MIFCICLLAFYRKRVIGKDIEQNGVAILTDTVQPLLETEESGHCGGRPLWECRGVIVLLVFT